MVQQFKAGELPTYVIAKRRVSKENTACLDTLAKPTEPPIGQVTRNETVMASPEKRILRKTRSAKSPVKKFQRPSLSEQLASIGNAASALTLEISKNKPGMVFSTPSKVFIVGKIACKYPSPIEFYSDKVTYSFHHPYQPKDIQMHMYYRDMRQMQWKKQSTTFSFRLSQTLKEFGSKDYDANNVNHTLQIGFASISDYEKAKAHVCK